MTLNGLIAYNLASTVETDCDNLASIMRWVCFRPTVTTKPLFLQTFVPLILILPSFIVPGTKVMAKRRCDWNVRRAG